ncbi:MAG: glycosyltransferase family 2 protein [Bacteroidota bacterium]
MIDPADIHIFIPAFNEASSIEAIIVELRQLGYLHVYVVDDGSTDQTRVSAKAAQAKVIQHYINRGAGAATQTAIEYARMAKHPYMILMDADGQHLPQDLQALVQKMEQSNCDLVIGSRFLQSTADMPRSRRWFNRLANQLTNLMCRQNYTDSQSGFRMLNRKVIENLNLSLDEYGFCSEMIFVAEQKGWSIAEVPITIIYTPYSLKKGQNFFTGVQTALSFIRKIIFR